jgi:hypothetical protein
MTDQFTRPISYPHFPFSSVKRTVCIIMGVMTLLFIGGCQSSWDNSSGHGQSVNQAIQAQLVNPIAPEGNLAAPTGMDGPAARFTIDNYEKSFKNPRINQSNLGRVSGQTGSSTPLTGSNTSTQPQ